MKSIKLAFLLVFLLLGLSVYSQSKDTLLNRGSLFNFNIPNLNTANQNLDFKNLKIPKKISLSIYNRTTNLYDNYLGYGNTYIYSNSNVFFENKSNFLIDLFLGNDSFMESNSLMQNNYFMLNDDSSYQIRDSFNPYGASNIGQAIVGGIFGLLLND